MSHFFKNYCSFHFLKFFLEVVMLVFEFFSDWMGTFLWSSSLFKNHWLAKLAVNKQVCFYIADNQLLF